MVDTRRGYKINRTDGSLPKLELPNRIFIDDLVDITLIGKRTKEYGEVLNENILRLLEHFSCPSTEDDMLTPDISGKIGEVLERPVLGQLWYNSTISTLCAWNGTAWEKFVGYGDISGNSGFLFDGEKVPIPPNKYGSPGTLSNCNISVSPMFFNEAHVSYECFVDGDGILRCNYRNYTQASGESLSAYASYMIVCDNSYDLPPSLTPTPSPTPTVSTAVAWDIVHTGNGGSLYDGNTFYSTSATMSPSTRTDMYIDGKSYFNVKLALGGSGRVSVGICDVMIDTTQQGVRPGLTHNGVEVTLNAGGDGHIIYGSTSIFNFTPTSNTTVDFAVYAGMVWIRIRTPHTTTGWLGGGDPELLTSPTAHISGSRMYSFASIDKNTAPVVTLVNSAAQTTGDVPNGYQVLKFAQP